MPKKVLIVDDNEAARKFATLAVKRAMPDAEIRTAENGVDARQVTTSFRPDLIVLDHMMPKLDGWHYLEEVRQSEWGHRTPVLFHSAIDLRRDISKLSLTLFLRKPATLDEFTEALKKVGTLH